ncbi:MAG: phosphoglycerate kinase [Bacilli bacterium]|nr:phosphoglycerate kinase [Bacilli bacterium]
MKKTIRNYRLRNKKVIIRVDFNVPIKDGVIQDDNRIKMSLETINYALSKGAKVILMSHLGRVKTEEDKKTMSLKVVSERLSELLNKKVLFVPKTRGKELEEAIDKMNCGDILLMENTRFEDIDGKKESGNDLELGKYWASLGDIYINDAFATAHRAHASNVGIASNLKNGIGFLIEKELESFEPVLHKPKRPFTVILGGAKVSDKIGVIKNLGKKADYILIGGGMAYTFLKAEGYNIGNSLIDYDSLDFCAEMLEKYAEKIIIPLDSVNGLEISEDTKVRECLVNEINDDEIGLDIGSKTINLFKKYIEQSKSVIWNGPVGYFEIEKFANGTKSLCEILKQSQCDVIIGGGDTASAVINFEYQDAFKHISTGGGASLELLEGKELPGIKIINEKK